MRRRTLLSAAALAAALAGGAALPTALLLGRGGTPAYASPTPPTDRFPRAAASYIVVLDGRVLWEREAGTARAPASLVKIMTALVLLDPPWDSESIVTVSARAAGQTGARLGLRAGEKMKAGDLLTALLVQSANDAAVALAEHEAGNTARFVDAMNAKAKALGLPATRFANPTGLDAPGQRSSARDLWKLTETALGHAEFARRVALERAWVATVAGRRLELKTSNALLGRFEGAKGVKTGFTAAAGKCVVVLAERDQHRVLAVLLDARDRWWAADALVREAFDAAPAKD